MEQAFASCFSLFKFTSIFR